MRRSRRSDPVFALVVYAKRNVMDMASKAFRSISQQDRKPDKLIVVDDQSESGFDDVKERVLDLRVDGCHVQILRNERTPGLSGALNTALLKLMEYADERATYVTFVREEDWLRTDHSSPSKRFSERTIAIWSFPTSGSRGSRRPCVWSGPACPLCTWRGSTGWISTAPAALWLRLAFA